MKHAKKRELLSEVMKAIAIAIAMVAVGIAITLTFIGCDGNNPLTTMKPTTLAEQSGVTDDQNDQSDNTPIITGEPVKPVVDEIDPVEPIQTTVNDGFTENEYYYYNGVAVGEYLPLSSWVLDFPGRYRGAPPESKPNDFVGRVYMPVSGDDARRWAKTGYMAPVPLVTVTITHGHRVGEQVTTDEGGYYLFPEVAENELYLRVERKYLESKEVIVSRTGPTEIQEIGPNRVYAEGREENAPGIILVGLRWPDAVRSVLKEELLPHDLLYNMATESLDPRMLGRAGLYGYEDLLISIVNSPERKNRLSYGTFAHELAHARQHAVAIVHHGSGNTRDWEDTPEGRAYEAAWEKDLKDAPGKMYLIDEGAYFSDFLLENNAEFCSMYWRLGTGLDLYRDLYHGDDVVQMFQERAPNRFKWAQEHLNVHPTN